MDRVWRIPTWVSERRKRSIRWPSFGVMPFSATTTREKSALQLPARAGMPSAGTCVPDSKSASVSGSGFVTTAGDLACV